MNSKKALKFKNSEDFVPNNRHIFIDLMVCSNESVDSIRIYIEYMDYKHPGAICGAGFDNRVNPGIFYHVVLTAQEYTLAVHMSLPGPLNVEVRGRLQIHITRNGATGHRSPCNGTAGHRSNWEKKEDDACTQTVLAFVFIMSLEMINIYGIELQLELS